MESVSSNMMTLRKDEWDNRAGTKYTYLSEIVVRVTPDKVAAAPTMAYKPGMTPACTLESVPGRQRSLTVEVATTGPEQTRVRICVLQPLHPDPQYPARARSDAKRRNEYSCGHLDSESHDRQRALDNHGDQDRLHDRPDMRECPRIYNTQARMRVSGASAAFGKQIVDQFSPAHPGVRVQKT